MRGMGLVLGLMLFSLLVTAGPALAQAPAPAVNRPAAAPAGPSLPVGALTAERFAAMASGAVLAALFAELVMEAGGPYAMVLGTMGLVIGDWWYKEGFWPFNHHPAGAQPIENEGRQAPPTSRPGSDAVS